MKRKNWHPTTLPGAVDFLLATLPLATTDLIRGASDQDLAGMRTGLGAWVRNNLGLWNDGSRLLQACRTLHAEVASTVIIKALRARLIESATPEEEARSQQVWTDRRAEVQRNIDKKLAAIAAKDALLTDKVCPFCSKPCPSYRVTCKHCRRIVRRRNGTA